LEGCCIYGEKCRYDHIRPSYRPKEDRQPSGYIPPPTLKPDPTTIDDLDTILPISQLRLAGAAPDNHNNINIRQQQLQEQQELKPSSSSPTPIIINKRSPIKIDLPKDPFATGSTSDDDVGEGEAEQEDVHSHSHSHSHPSALDDPSILTTPTYANLHHQHHHHHHQYYNQHQQQQAQYYSGNEGGGGSHSGSYTSNGNGGGLSGSSSPYMAPWAVPQNVNAIMMVRNGSNGSFGGGGGGYYYAAAAAAAAAATTTTNSDMSASMCGEWYVTGICSKSMTMTAAEDGACIGECKLVHGEWCETCEKYALHPTDGTQRAQHTEECTNRHERLAARARSAAVECGICLERVLEKSNLSDRRFGLLACDHPFCLPCIRNWRSKNDDGTVDVDTALRTCPVCRVTTYMVTPSVVWPGSKEEKDAIVEGYRGKLAATPCKYFAYGEGTCPFGTSCVYKHSYADGRLEDRGGGGGLRRVAVDDGEVKVLGEVKLSDYISIRPARQRRRR